MRIRLIHFALAVLVAVGLSSTAPPQRAASRIGTPIPASPPADRAEVTLPVTPVGHQLGWVLERLSGRGEPLTPSDVPARFAPSYLETVSAADTVAATRRLAAAYGPLGVGGLVRNPTRTQAVVFLTARTGDALIAIIAVEPTDPHRITTLTFQLAPDGLGDATTGLANTGGLVDVGGRSLYLWCLGPVPTDGEPTVLLEAGYGDDSTVWLAVQAALASDTRVCSYDRANAPGGASDPAPTPRTGHDVAADLHALLEAADAPGPYVLVGHSLGGLFVRQYAGAYPDGVAGLVLVDPSHEDQEVRLEELVGPELWAEYERVEAGAVDAEGLDVGAALDETRQARAAAPLPEVPLVVLTHGLPLDASQLPAGWPIEADERQWRELHADLAGLVPGGRQTIAERSGHYIQIDQPELVVAAIREVAAEVGGAGTPASTPVGGNGGSTEVNRSANTEATASGAMQ